MATIYHISTGMNFPQRKETAELPGITLDKISAKRMTNIPITCETVLCLPNFLASKTIPLFKLYNLKPVMINSRNIIKLTIQEFTTPNSRKAQNTPIISILSAIGSKILPKSEIKFFFRAMYPSKKSVIEARQKITKAIRRETKLFCNINPMQIKERMIRKIVSLFGIFIS